MIGIALYPPRWFHGQTLHSVSPTHSILHEESHEVYTERFKKEVLAKVAPRMFVEDIERISGGNDVALCCFEKPDDFCHRHIVAEWLNEKLGLGVEEFGISKEPKYKQGDLFG